MRQIVRVGVEPAFDELQPWTNANTNTNINTNTNANTYKKDPNNTKVRDWVFLLNIKDHKTQCLTGTPVLWRVMCKPPPLLCSNLAQLQSNSGQTWRMKYQCLNLNHDKGNLAIFCWTEKTQQLKKKNLIEAVWTSPQSGFNLKGFHCKKYKKWYKIDALCAIFAIFKYSHFDT